MKNFEFINEGHERSYLNAIRCANHLNDLLSGGHTLLYKGKVFDRKLKISETEPAIFTSYLTKGTVYTTVWVYGTLGAKGKYKFSLPDAMKFFSKFKRVAPGYVVDAFSDGKKV